MMENNQKNLNAFLHLIKNHKPLFLIDNRHQDLNQAKDNFRETEDDLADDIIEWCAKYTDIKQALRQTRKELYPAATKSTKSNRLPGSIGGNNFRVENGGNISENTCIPSPGGAGGLHAPPKSSPRKSAKETLLNAIQESFPNQSK